MIVGFSYMFYPRNLSLTPKTVLYIIFRERDRVPSPHPPELNRDEIMES